MADSKSAALPLGDAPIGSLHRTVAGGFVKARSGERAAPAPPARRAACAAAGGGGRAASANRPKQVAPEPLMRASRQPGCARSQASASPIAGHSRSAAASRSLRKRARSAAMRAHPPSAAGSMAGSEKARSRARNTRRWRPATPGLTSTMPQDGRMGATPRISPMPPMRAGSPSRQTGTSAPEPERDARPARPRGRPDSTAGRAGAAPPPRRPSRRRCRSRPAGACPAPAARRAPPGRLPQARCAARSTRLSPSSSPAANGPRHSSASASAGSARSPSAAPGNTARLSSR